MRPDNLFGFAYQTVIYDSTPSPVFWVWEDRIEVRCLDCEALLASVSEPEYEECTIEI